MLLQYRHGRPHYTYYWSLQTCAGQSQYDLLRKLLMNWPCSMSWHHRRSSHDQLGNHNARDLISQYRGPNINGFWTGAFKRTRRSLRLLILFIHHYVYFVIHSCMISIFIHAGHRFLATFCTLQIKHLQSSKGLSIEVLASLTSCHSEIPGVFQPGVENLRCTYTIRPALEQTLKNEVLCTFTTLSVLWAQWLFFKVFTWSHSKCWFHT
jgi:hypothetical protein